MSSTTMRHYDATMSFMPLRSVRKAERVRRRMNVRLSRRRFKQMTRTLLTRSF